jgi:ribosomal protein L13E
MRARLKPLLFDDEYLDEASASRASPAGKAVRSEHARAKDASKLADDGLPLQSSRTLLQDLGTLAYNITHTALNPDAKIVPPRGPRRFRPSPSPCSASTPPVPSSRNLLERKVQAGRGLASRELPKSGLADGLGVCSVVLRRLQPRANCAQRRQNRSRAFSVARNSF